MESSEGQSVHTDRDQPDHTDDPRDVDVSDQMPEEQQEGAAEGNEPAREERDPDAPAPDTSSGEKGDPGQATGNPDAAGG